MASNGLVFYESVSSGDWDFLTAMANAVGGQAAGFWCTVCLRQQKDKNTLLADLIIDKVLINSNTY